MTDRQARIAAGVRAFWEAGPGSAQTDIDEYEFADVLRARFAAGLDAADAIGRERVNEKEARTLIRYLLGEQNELFVTPIEDEGRAELERLHNERIEHIVTLLIAAPAERGHDETGETE